MTRVKLFEGRAKRFRAYLLRAYQDAPDPATAEARRRDIERFDRQLERLRAAAGEKP